MSYQSRKMNSILTFSIFIVLVNIQLTLARKCYVCGVGSEEPFTQNSKSKLEYPNLDIPLSCDEFDSSNNLEKFIFTCPSDHMGCITTSDGTDVTRTCDPLAIDDCQTANGVQYCYCSTDLCNKRKIIPIRGKHETLYDDEDTSDVDEFEASGYGSIDTIPDDPIVTTSSTIQTIESPSTTTVTVATRIMTVTTTTEAITANKVFTSYNQNHTTFPTTTAEATSYSNATNRNFVKCSKVIFIMQLLMLIFPSLAMLS